MVSRWLKLILILFSLGGCCRQQDLELRKEIKTWSPYTQQQELTFQNQAGTIISFTTATQHYNQNGEDKVCGTYDIETQKTTLTPTSDFNFKIEITLSHEVLVSLKAYTINPAGNNFNIQFNTVAEQYVSDDWRDLYLKSTQLNGKTFENTLRFFGTPVNNNLALAEIFYSKNKGLVAFKTFAGDWFYLQ